MLRRNAAFGRRFQQVYVAEPSMANTISVIRGLKERYEGHHGVTIQDRALVVAAQLSSRYITGRHLPDKAIDLVDEACASVNVRLNSQHKEIDKLERKSFQLEVELHTLEKEMNQASKDRLVEVKKELAELRDELQPLKLKHARVKATCNLLCSVRVLCQELFINFVLAERRRDLARVADLKKKLVAMEGTLAVLKLEIETVCPEHITEVVSRWTGIPLTRLGQNEKERLIGLAKRLHKQAT